MKDRRNKNFFLSLIPLFPYSLIPLLVLPAYASSTTTASVELTTAAILAKIDAFDKTVDCAIFEFEEEFLLVPTGEKERLKGRVYFDKASSRVRFDYTGKVKYKVWIASNTIYFYDTSLNQMVVRQWDDFTKVHLQAMMNFPLFFDSVKFTDNFDFSVVASSCASSLVWLRADPKGKSQPYHLLFGVDASSGQPRRLDLVMDNYRAGLQISRINLKAKFSDKLFDRNLPPDAAVLDLREK
ncbi:MAG: outer membrane lipoprotein carrier protein LolA [Elusimicrobia bacterium]|nr:outer membrane lipoprotein carrier protein LolA [Elusimicrobiota bacterium]